MKHDWMRDDRGDIKPLNEDADHPVAVCRVCGETSGCLHADPYCNVIGGDSGLDADDCEGIDLSVTVTITIGHPGKATGWDDRTAVTMRKAVPLSVLLDADPDPVGEALADFVERTFGQWRGVRTAHEPAWRAAVEAASRRSAEETTEGKP